MSRASKINRILLPAVLQWLGQGQNPDMGLLNWRKLEERFGTDSEYLGFLARLQFGRATTVPRPVELPFPRRRAEQVRGVGHLAWRR